jgi:hypothetical protein
VTASRHHNAKAYQKVKARAKARSAAVTLAGQDIGGLPPIADRAPRPGGPRLQACPPKPCGGGFFCESYFPHLFTLDWSADHLRVIGKVERVVRDHETLAVAMPRGSGKTGFCLTAWVAGDEYP